MGKDEIFIPLEQRHQKAIVGRNAWAYYNIPYNSGDGLMGLPFRLSPFVFLFYKKNYCALYHSLNLRKIFGDERLVKIYKMGKSNRLHTLQHFVDVLREREQETFLDELDLLIENEFLIPGHSDPLFPLKKMQNDRQLNCSHIGLMYLLISNDCNLRCGYCSIESFARKPHNFAYSYMSSKLARKGIDLFAEILDERIREPKIIYYGGEPFLNRDTWLDSLQYIREKEKEGLFNRRMVEVSIVSNGTLITDELAGEMKRLSVGCSISIDGFRHHHDRMRKYRNGKGSWDDALRGYYILKKHMGGCGISCTLGPHNFMDAEEIAEFFATRLECRGMGFNIIKGLPNGNELEIPPKVVTEQIIKVYQIFRKFGIYEDRIMRKINAFVNEEPWFHDCGGYGGQIALCADGYIGPCHIAADDHRLCWGHIDDCRLKEEILWGKMTYNWCSRSPIKMSACFDCIGLGICGGGCADESYVKYGDIYSLDKNFCEHCKMLIEWMCDDLAEKLIKSGDLHPGRITRKRALHFGKK